MGGAAGLLVATELASFLIGLAFPGVKYIPIDATPSLPVLGFTFLLSLVTGVVFGVAPCMVGIAYRSRRGIARRWTLCRWENDAPSALAGGVAGLRLARFARRSRDDGAHVL